MGFFENHSLKMILALKCIILCYIIVDQGWVSFGDKPLVAQDGTNENTPNQEPSSADNGTNANNPADKSAEQDLESEDEDESLMVKRKSYLDDLLDLPKINPDKLKKEDVSRYLKILDRKNTQVESRVKLLTDREKDLKDLEKTIDNKLKRLDEEIEFFNATLQKEKEINKERLDRLVEFYQKMTPKKAAPVFEKMDKDLVTALFQRIPKKQTMTILSLMNPDKSVELTEYFGRIRSGKEYELLKEINTSLRKEFEECKGMPQ